MDDVALREGLDRAADFFRLHRLSAHADADELIENVFANFGIDQNRRDLLTDSVRRMLPFSSEPLPDGLMASSMCAGVLVGLLLADATRPTVPDAVPDFPPADR